MTVTSISAEVPDTQGSEKRRWSDNFAESVKNVSEIRKTGSFDVQSGRGRKRIDST